MNLGLGLNLGMPHPAAQKPQAKPEQTKPLEYEKKPYTPPETKCHGG